MTSSVARYPLSAQQRRWWASVGSVPAEPVGCGRVEVQIDGPLDRERLRGALTAVVQRHESLRADLVCPPDRQDPFQTVAETANLSLDISNGPESPVSGSSPVRAVLASETPGRQVLTVEVAQPVDAESLIAIARETALAYGGGELPECVQYAQFDAWQQAAAAEADPDDAAWLSTEPSGDHPVTRMGTGPAKRGIPNRVIGTYRLDRRRAELLSAPGLAPDVALLTAWGLVLAGRSGTAAAVVGTAFSCRDVGEFGSTVGLLGRVLPVSVARGDAETFGDCVADVARSVSRTRDWLAEWGWPESTDSDAWTRAQFEYLDLPDPIVAGDAVLTVRRVDWGYEPADLRLVAMAGADETTIELLAGHDADPDFTADLAAGMWAFLDALPGAAAVADIPVLGAAERQRLLLPRDEFTTEATSVLSLVRRHSVERATADAIVSGGQVLSYGELDTVIAQAASGLRRRGLGNGARVAIAADGTGEANVAMLAVLRAGAVAVPLDPTGPDQVLRQVADGIGVGHLVWHAAAEPPAADKTGLQVVAWRDLLAEAAEPVDVCDADPTSPAYIVLTAVAAGWPRGVVVTHGALANYLVGIERRYGLRPGMTHAAVAPAASQLSFTAGFGALATGGVFLALLPGGAAGDTASTGSLGERAVDVVKTTPDRFLGVLSGDNAVLPRELLIVGGGAPDERLEPKAAEMVPAGLTLIHEYGPPETGVAVAARPVDDQAAARDLCGDAHVPVGLPLGGSRLYVLDRQMRPVPAGVRGEIYVGGPCVADGYANDPALTAKCFRPDPFGDTPGGRLFRTGDVGVWTPDRELILLETADGQVPTRGFRVDLATIRDRLVAHPWVEDAVAVVRRDLDGRSALEGYAVASSAALDEADTLTSAHTAAWAEVFDGFYAEPDVGVEELEADRTSWISSYTGEEMTWEELEESVDGLVNRMTTLRKESVLEIGFGTGLILYRLAPMAGRYVATEISERAFDRARRGMAAAGNRFGNVELVRREAADFSGWGNGTFDLVVLNSVIQYFPSVDYLLKMLREAVRVIRPGGHIVLGDVRDITLAPVFHCSVALQRAPGDGEVSAVRELARRNLLDDSELLVAPELFEALAELLPEVSDVRVQLKRGRIRNELSKFRYDVVIGIGASDLRDPSQTVELDWTAVGEPDATEALALLSGDGPFVLRDVLDARLAGDVSDWNAVENEADSVADVRAVTGATTGVEPEDWWGLDQSFRVEVQPARSGTKGRYDVAIGRTGQPLPQRPVPSSADLESHASKPMRSRLSAMMARELRRHLADRLPDYLVPDRVFAVDSLPQTISSGVDQRRLSGATTRTTQERVPPRTPVEEKVAEVWAEILGVAEVGVTDDFFEIGGHSLLVIKVIYELGELFGVDLPLSRFFVDPTVAGVSVNLTKLLMEGADQE